MSANNILYIEANIDGTVGGSHHCLLEIVKYIDRGKYIPSVVFYQDNALVPDFEKVCDVFIITQNEGLIIEKVFPVFYSYIRNYAAISKIVLYFQKVYNFLVHYVPNLIYICRFLVKHKIDLVHANNTPDLSDWLIASKLLRIKMVSHLRFPWSPTYVRKKLLRYYDKVISISNYVTEQLKVKGIPCGNVVTIHDGIDVRSMPATNDSIENMFKELNISTATSLIGVIGNIRRWKGQHVAIESLRHIVSKNKNILCLFIGEISSSPYDTEYYSDLKELVKKYDLGNNVYFTGYRKDVLNILSKLDILIHTSIIPEPFGRVVLEGMIFRKPVIATNHGGPMESIVDGISGFLIPPEEPKLLADKIIFLMENKDIAKEVGDNARKHVEEKFSVEGNVQKIEGIYSSFLET